VPGSLNATGSIKSFPSFKDYDGISLVFTKSEAQDKKSPSTWTVMLSSVFPEQ